MIKHGAEIREVDHKGQTILHYAAWGESVEIMDCVLEIVWKFSWEHEMVDKDGKLILKWPPERKVFKSFK